MIMKEGDPNNEIQAAIKKSPKTQTESAISRRGRTKTPKGLKD